MGQSLEDQLELILQRVSRKEDERANYKSFARDWQRMWQLDPGFGDDLAGSVEEGRENVIDPTPYNVVNLAQRLLSTKPRIQYIPCHPNVEKYEEWADQINLWLDAFWRANSFRQNRDVVGDSTWNVLVKGRFAFDVKWVKDQLPDLVRSTTPPILVRALDPMNVGIHEGPNYTEFAYHKYDAPLLDILQTYPDLRKLARKAKNNVLQDKIEQMDRNNSRDEAYEVCVIDYWRTNADDGKVWNAILVDDEFAVVPNETDYPCVPIITGRGDNGVNAGDAFEGLSILYPMMNLWKYNCRLLSQKASGLMWHFWPAILVSNDGGEPIDDIEIAPGATTPIPPGTKVEFLRGDPNVPLAQAVSEDVSALIQQSAFPEVMYGKAPGDLQAGYGVSLLTDQAKGRIKKFAEALETGITKVNSLVLALISAKGKDGVSLWGEDRTQNQFYRLTVTPEMINGHYDNKVSLTPEIAQEQIQKQTVGMGLVRDGIISKRTFREFYANIELPGSEPERIAIEEAIGSDELRAWRLRHAISTFSPDKWTQILAGTELLPPPPEGFHWLPNGRLAPGAEQPPPQPGPPPPTNGTIPPGGGQPPFPGAQPAAGPPPPIQQPGISGPMGGGIPPEQQPMLTPEMAMPGQAGPQAMPPGMNPDLWAQLTGNPLTPAEQLAAQVPPPPGAY